MKTIILSVFFAIPCVAQPSLKGYYAEAMRAYQDENYALFYDRIGHAHALHPYHQGILFQCGLAAALVNKPDDAVQYLSKAIHINAGFDLSHSALASLKDRKDFIALIEKQKVLQKVIIHSDTALTLSDRQLHPEAVAFDSRSNKFYLGSIHKRKIVSVDKNKTAVDFVASGHEDLAAVTSIRIDNSKNVLWAGSSPLPEMIGYDSTLKPAVYKYDLKNKKLLFRYYAHDSLAAGVFGDIALNSHGDAFVSDSKSNTIFYVDEKTKTLQRYFFSREFLNIQGITFSDDDNFLFIADYVKGIFRLTVKTQELILLPTSFDISTKAIDGMLYYDNSLIAIQNAVYPMRVTRYQLNSTKDALENFTIIDAHHPAFNEPTNGCLVNDTLYYIGNSQWGGYNERHQIKSSEQLQDIVILKYDLKQSK